MPELADSQSRDLFAESRATAIAAVIRQLDIARAEGEIKLRLKDLNETVKRLEEARVVTQELLEAAVSL